ncbi:MAG TPA: diguanylate cyclase, partial [Actinomycetales bacterium]
LCRLVTEGAIPTLVPDAAAEPAVAAHPLRLSFGFDAHAGVPLEVDGRLLGTVCAIGWGNAPSLNERDVSTLHTVAHYIGTVRSAAARRATAPEPEPVSLPGAAATLAGSQTLEELARPMLRLLHQVTGLDSTYLTIIDWADDRQRIAYSLNSGDLQLPEGIDVPWGDTLCRRALDQGVPFTNEVPRLWGDSQAAADLGIVSYLSVPVQDSHGGVVGTLCGASGRSVDIVPQDLATLELFARLVGGQLEREAAHAATSARAEQLEARTRELGTLAHQDSLTGLANRAGIRAWLDTVLASLRPDLEQLAVAFLDVDGFKTVNDTLGHAAGDEVLRRLAASVQQVGRTGDLHGRLGGDELVVAAVLPPGDAVLGGWIGRLQRAARVELDGYVVRASVGVATCTDPVADADAVLARADRAMYEVKRSRHLAA